MTISRARYNEDLEHIAGGPSSRASFINRAVALAEAYEPRLKSHKRCGSMAARFFDMLLTDAEDHKINCS